MELAVIGYSRFAHWIIWGSVWLLSTLDMSLTYYQLFLDKKKGSLHLERERNFIPRLLIGKKLEAWRFVPAGILLTGIVVLFASMAYEGGFALAGMLLVVNRYHLENLGFEKKNYNNEEYWRYRREMRRVMRW